MANNMDNYWINEIESYKYQLHTGPDDKHDLWKWRGLEDRKNYER